MNVSSVIYNLEVNSTEHNTLDTQLLLSY